MNNIMSIKDIQPPLEVGKCMSEQSMLSLYELRQKSMLCDAVIRLDDGTTFPVHRAILSSCSSYFRCLFTTTLHTREKTDVYLPGLTHSLLESILDYAYIRKVNVTSDNVSQLLAASDYLSVLGLRKICEEFLIKSITPENVVGVLIFARDHFCLELEHKCIQYIMKEFTQVSMLSLELLKLPASQIKSIIGSDQLNVKHEEIVWEFIIRWIDQDPAGRADKIVELMSQIRLGLMETQFFLEQVKDHPYVTANDNCRPIIIETLKFLYDLEMITQKDGEIQTPEIARPRVPHEVLFVIGGWSGGSPTNFMETYDTRADRWVKVEQVDPTGPRAYHGTAVIGTDIYVIGGFDGMDYFNSCRCFNAVTKTWREIAPMNAKRCYVSVTMLNDYIFAMGGYDGHHRQNTAEKYDYRTNQWTIVAPMNAQRSDASATSLNGKIYITGGFNGQECMNTAEVYDPVLNQWSILPPMRFRRSGVSCVAYHNCIYVIGGFNGISRMCSGERYNPMTNVWTLMPDMYNPRSNFAIEVIDDMIFVIGGFNGVTTIYHVECYDDRTNEWYEATDMNIYRSALSASVMSGLPNVQDYIHKHRDRLMEEKRLKLLALERQRLNPQTQAPLTLGTLAIPILRNNNQTNLNIVINDEDMEAEEEDEADNENELDYEE